MRSLDQLIQEAIDNYHVSIPVTLEELENLQKLLPKRKFTIPLVYSMNKNVDVEASSLKEAVDIALNIALENDFDLDSGKYIGDSIQVDYELMEEHYPAIKRINKKND